jgi:hypothetical protein
MLLVLVVTWLTNAFIYMWQFDALGVLCCTSALATVAMLAKGFHACAFAWRFGRQISNPVSNRTTANRP